MSPKSDSQLKPYREGQVARRDRRNQDDVRANTTVLRHDERRENRAQFVIVADTPLAVVVSRYQAAHRGQSDVAPTREFRRPNATAIKRRRRKRVSEVATGQRPLRRNPAFNANAGVELIKVFFRMNVI